MGTATLFLMYLNKPILNVYVGAEYEAAWIYSPFLIVSFFADALATFWGSFYIATKSMNKYLHSAMIGAIVNIILNFWLIRQIGALGAAIATMICYIIVFIVRAKGMESIVNVKMINKELLSILICLCIGLIISYLPDLWVWPIGIINIILYLFFNKNLILILIKQIRILIKKFI